MAGNMKCEAIPTWDVVPRLLTADSGSDSRAKGSPGFPDDPPSD